mgnify:CR=1|tara:strand:+ start:299 stop:559 length:261 start_codon:yes stop_codon:yes gene_type:complete
MSRWSELHPGGPELNEEAIVLEGEDLDDAILGTSEEGILIYNYDLLVDAFKKQGMDTDEAREWIDFNVLPLTNQGAGFIMCYPKSE